MFMFVIFYFLFINNYIVYALQLHQQDWLSLRSLLKTRGILEVVRNYMCQVSRIRRKSPTFENFLPA